MALVDWPFFEITLPELKQFKDELRKAIETLKAAKDGEGKCPKCVIDQYKGWERTWLIMLNVAAQRNAGTWGLIAHFLNTEYEQVRAQQMANRLQIAVSRRDAVRKRASA